MDLPENFIPYKDTIEYYRNEHELDCLSTKYEKFRFFLGYHLGRKYWVYDHKPIYQSWVDPNSDCWWWDLTSFTYRWDDYEKGIRGEKSFDENSDLKEVSNDNIESYLKYIYPVKILKPIITHDASLITLFNKSNTNKIILPRHLFIIYCKYYHDDTYKTMHHMFEIPFAFSNDTAKAIERLICNNESDSHKTSDIQEYIKLIKYLDVSFQ